MPEQWIITHKEKQVLDYVVKLGTLTEACRQLGIKKTTGSSRIRRLKDRYLKARDFVDDYERYQRKMPGRFL